MTGRDEKGEQQRRDTVPGRHAILVLLDRELTAEQLDENTRRVERPAVAESRQAGRVLVFRLRSEALAVPAGDVDRVTRVAKVHHVPHRSNRIVRGIVNIGGELQLCGSLANLLDLSRPVDEPSDHQQQRMIVLGRGRNRWAFSADRVEGVATVALDDGRSPPVTVQYARDGYVETVVSLGEQRAALLKTDRIVAGFQAALS